MASGRRTSSAKKGGSARQSTIETAPERLLPPAGAPERRYGWWDAHPEEWDRLPSVNTWGPEWDDQELCAEWSDAHLRFMAGDSRPLAAFIRRRGIPPGPPREFVADVLAGRELVEKPKVRQRRQVLALYHTMIELRDEELRRSRTDPSVKVRFPLKGDLERWLALVLMGNADRSESIRSIVARHASPFGDPASVDSAKTPEDT